MKKEEKKEKRGKLKGIKIFLYIIIIIIMIGIYNILIQIEGGLDKNNPMSKRQVVQLLNKGKEYPNYYYSSETKIIDNFTNNKTEIYVKDGIEKVVNNGKVSSWENENTDEHITIMGEHKGEKYASISKLSEYNDNNEGDKYNQHGFDYSLIANGETYNYNFEYLGRKKIDGRTTVVVKVWDNDKLKILGNKFYIDEETGLIIKTSDYSVFGIIVFKMTTDRNVRLDIVTDEDVKRPDLTGYKILGS